MKEVQDRVVQFSNRYKLTNAETGEVLGTFDFDEVTGTVQQVGTEIDAELFQTIADDLAARVKLSGGELKDTVVTFSDISGTAANVASGDTSATLWGKVKNWFSRLKALAFKDKISNTDVAENAAIAQSKVNGLESALAGKQPTITGAATSITNNNLTASRVVVSDESGKIDVSAVTATELNYISGADRNIQNQIEDIKDGTTPPVQATRAQQDGDGANIVQTYAKKNGSYSELTAGKAVRLSQSVKMQATNSAGGQLGWFKLATVSGAKLAAINGNSSYSATLLINGINEPALSFGGIVEIDCRIESSQIVTDSNRVQPKILCGGLREEYICAVPNTETNELDVYFLINSSYAGYSATVIDEGYTRLMQPSETAITLAGTFYNAEAPSGAVYAVNVNRAATAGMLSSTQLQSADDLNNLSGSEYYGKNFWWAGNGYPINAPYNSGGYLQVNNIAGYTLQAAYIFSVKSDNNIPTEYQRVKGQNGVWSEWEEIATSEGTYPNLTAGSADRLSRRLYIGVGTGTPGWYKVGSLKVSDILSQSSATNTTSSFSMLFLVTGLNENGINQTGVAHSGIFELECRMITGAFADGYINIKILAGDIRAEDYCYAMDTAGSEITLYCNLGGTYMATDFCILSEQYGSYATKAFTFDGTFESAEMPSGGTVGINVSRAAYDGDGNDISETYATKTEVNAKYTKPATGIPESDLSEGVQDKLNSGGGIDNAVTYTEQTLTDEQQAQARENIRAAGTRGTYPDLTAGKAISDADGNDIQTTYATKTEVANAAYIKVSATNGTTGLLVETQPMIGNNYDVTGLTVQNLETDDFVLARVRFSTLATNYYICVLRCIQIINNRPYFELLTYMAESLNTRLYEHHITLRMQSSSTKVFATFTLTNDSNAFINTMELLQTALDSAGFTMSNYLLQASGTLFTVDVLYTIYGVTNVRDKFTIFCTNPVNGNSMQYDTFSDVDINDSMVRIR